MAEELLTTLVRSPAGSGKTERLARRYIALLKKGIPPERILTITFTEKAAAEMKERIFRILKKEDPILERKLKESILKLRISTIDSFCFSLIRTFSPYLELPPDLEVNPESEILWILSSYDTLMGIAQEKNSPDYSLLSDLISDGGFRGWPNLLKLFEGLFKKRVTLLRRATEEEEIDIDSYLSQLAKMGIDLPLEPEKDKVESLFLLLDKNRHLFLTKEGKARKAKKGEGIDYERLKEFYTILAKKYYQRYFEKILSLFQNRFLAEYKEKKHRKGILDFPDLEFLVFDLLTNFPEWQNILYLFDQHTDHILVDEFQDTSFLQWAIIDKLTEEWRSGLGAKREREIEPTLFLVGDEKQSIYFFRNAQSEIFARAREKLLVYLGDKFREETVKDNYRSLNAIIEFTNYFFSRLFIGGEGKPFWQTPYSEFIGRRQNAATGKVEIILDEKEGNMPERRRREAEIIAQRIKTLLGEEIVFDREEKPIPASYEHFAILLRRRTHLSLYEKALKDAAIPYLVVKGVGFYQETEVQLLCALVNFLVEPTDNFSLYLILKFLFSLSEKEILLLGNRPGDCLYQKIEKERKEIAEELASYREKIFKLPISLLLEEILNRRGVWGLFPSDQQYYNMKKFIRICEELEWKGKSLWEIKDYLARAKENTDEPKADVSWEGIKAVRIMTVHAAKGLEFPIIFFAGLDENLLSYPRKEDFIMEEGEKGISLLYLPEKNFQKEEPLFQERKEKQLEEEKRIFYVACTRARDYLILTGILSDKNARSRLEWLQDVFSLKWQEGRISSPVNLPGLEFLSGEEIFSLAKKKEEEKVEMAKEAVKTYPLLLSEIGERERVIKPVTKETNEDLRRHGEGAIIFGEVMHKILERIARGNLVWQKKAVSQMSERLFLLSGVSKEEIKIWVRGILRQLAVLEKSGLKEIILPQEGGYAELPFLLMDGDFIYQGRIDRVIVRKEEVAVYDYKTYRVKEEEIPFLLDFYEREQMAIYRKAVSFLFPGKKVLSYLIFTALGRIFSLPSEPKSVS